MDLSRIKKAYVIGIKGSGVIAVVQILDAMGVKIIGSDTREKFFTDQILKKLKIKYIEKFSIKNIPDSIDLVIYSTAYNEKNNIEFAECLKRRLKMISYPEILAELFNHKYGISVCGTHGKTTTSAMLSDTLKNGGDDPSAVIGSRVKDWGGNALLGKGAHFVIEADEFQNKLKLYKPKGVIFTSADWDHPDTYRTVSEYMQAFSDFVARIPRSGFLVVWGDSVVTEEISKSARCKIIKYGFFPDNDVLIAKKNNDESAPRALRKFQVSYFGKDLGEFETNLVGDHNILNSTAVIAACSRLGLNLEKIREGIKNFKGTTRRFEYIGERNGAILIDDYGHHPEEIKATLKAAREIYPEKNIIAVFHPHSYSRTEALFQDFAQSFDSADKVLVLDIYGSAREYSGNVSSSDLVNLINTYNRGKAEYVPTIKEAVKYLKNKIGIQDVVICIGAGNVFEVAEKLKEK